MSVGCPCQTAEAGYQLALAVYILIMKQGQSTSRWLPSPLASSLRALAWASCHSHARSRTGIDVTVTNTIPKDSWLMGKVSDHIIFQYKCKGLKERNVSRPASPDHSVMALTLCSDDIELTAMRWLCSVFDFLCESFFPDYWPDQSF